MAKMIIAEPDPMYYKGWAIWPSPMGIVACERTDTSMPDTTTFGSMEEAIRYIDKKTERKK